MHKRSRFVSLVLALVLLVTRCPSSWLLRWARKASEYVIQKGDTLTRFGAAVHRHDR